MTKKTLNIDIKYTSIFKPAFAMTVHKSQGSTFTRPYSIYEYKTMKHRMLYVAITRAKIKNLSDSVRILVKFFTLGTYTVMNTTGNVT